MTEFAARGPGFPGKPGLTRAALVAALALLVACGAPPPPEGYRDPARPIGSMAVLEASQLAGDWHEVAGFGSCASPGQLNIAAGTSAISGQSCFLPVRGTVPLTVLAPGRFRSASAEFWVLWADFDGRTLVLGTPDGSFGAVLNRDPAIPSDRLEAVRRILTFNGYDVSRLTLVTAR